MCGEYKMDATIQKKMRLNKCDVYTAKETLGYKERKFCQRHEEQQKEKKNREGQEKKQIYCQITGASKKYRREKTQKKKRNKEI